MERKEAIERLKQLRLDYTEFWEEIKNETTEALDMAIASLETDEAYQLEYEKTTKPTIEEFIEYAQKEFGVIIKAEKSDNPDTFEKLFGTTKNNLGVDAVSRQAINGYIDYILSHGMGKKKSFDFIKKFVAKLPPVTPQESKSEWEHDHEILKAYSDGANEVLDKIRAEIEEVQTYDGIYIDRAYVLEIIDKYKAESEG